MGEGGAGPQGKLQVPLSGEEPTTCPEEAGAVMLRDQGVVWVWWPRHHDVLCDAAPACACMYGAGAMVSWRAVLVLVLVLRQADL
mmetsp:Transcript_12557/g.27093  ORF Transcript_12557/g.27093 Transcript_12557/m.27093 type:complete len:85 (+) Transcript_12557:49-303(+)